MAHWLPLESNPDVMNKFVRNLGMQDGFAYTDVWGFDPELLQTVPTPVVAVILLFPVSEGYVEHRKATAEAELSGDTPGLFFMKQTIGNACGTIGIIHSIANNLDKITLGEGFLARFLAAAQGVSPDERAALLEADETIASAHQASAIEGQTQAPEPDEDVNLHFVCFVNKEGTLYQLDGCRSGPVAHGPTTQETFLADAVAVVQQFMGRDPDELRFTVIALAAE